MRGKRNRPDSKRPSVTASVVVQQPASRAKAHVTIGYYSPKEGGGPCEIFCRVAKTGTDLQTAYDSWARTASKALQHGMPIGELAASIRGTRDTFAGQIVSPDELTGKSAGSLWDAIGQFLEVV